MSHEGVSVLLLTGTGPISAIELVGLYTVYCVYNYWIMFQWVWSESFYDHYLILA